MTKIFTYIDKIVSLLMLAVIIAVILFTAHEVFQLFVHIADFNGVAVLHSVALVVILVKAYRLLLFYMESHHVSVRYIIEISIIAPAVELIFAPANRALGLNVLYAAFSIAAMIVYLYFYNKIRLIDEDAIKEPDILA